MMAAPSVTTIPATIAISAVDGENTTPVTGRSNPKAMRRALSPAATPTTGCHPDDRGQHPDAGRLDEHRGKDLRLARTDRTQECVLADLCATVMKNVLKTM